MYKIYIQTLVATALYFIFMVSTNSSVIVQLSVQQGPDAVNDVDNIYIKLFDDLTPKTVDNFLNYVNDGDYTNSFFHRTAPGFVIQGGGFLFNSPNTFSDVPVDIPVVNEFAKSNTLGTIAMAKLGEDPDSATSQWFFNLADNSENLDNQNGGFTVFGEVIGDGMTVINTMATVPVFNKTSINSAFSDLPLVGYTDGDDINFGNLVAIASMNERFSITIDFSPAGTIILGDTLEPEDVDFGIVTVGSVVTATVTIENRHIDTLTIGAIANIDVLLIPYQINDNACENTSLSQNETCNIIINFSPASQEGVFNDTINIEFTTLGLSYTLNIHGESSLTPLASNIVLSNRNIEFDEIEVYDFSTNPPPEIIRVQITNEGNLNLNLLPFEVTGEFKLDTANCLLVNNPIQPGESCELQIGFFPESIGLKSGIFTINSDDPDEPVITIPLTGSGSLDNDRVLTSIEDLAPNNGDGNNDDLPDSEQNNVISIDTGNGSYVTIVIPENEKISDFIILDENQLVNPPGGSELGRVHRFSLSIDQPFVNVATEVGIILPAGVNVKTYYLYGPTNDNTNPHWYEFIYDGVTGAQIFNNVTLTSPDGKTIQRTLVKLVFVDSLRGDSDMSVNGRINVQGAHLKTEPSSSDAGSINLLALLTFVVLMRFRAVCMFTRRSL